MRGGPFVDLDGKHVEAVKALIEQTLAARQAELIEFSSAVKQLDTLLRTEAKGSSLHPLYAKVPDLLKGYVELVSHLEWQPFLSVFRSAALQAILPPQRSSVALWITQNDERPFVLHDG